MATRWRARLRSRAHNFHCSTEKRCGQLERYYVSFNEIHVLYKGQSNAPAELLKNASIMKLEVGINHHPLLDLGKS